MANSNFVVKNGLTVGNVIVDAATGNVSGINNLAFASGTNGVLASGNSNVLVVANGNVTVSAVGTANVMTITATGANISGTLNTGTGNANVGNLGTATAIITTANVTTINSGLLQNGTSNVTVNSSGNVNISVGGNVLTVTSTGANIAGTLNTGTGNANVGNLGTATAIITTANVTTINSGLMQNGNSNVTITANSNVTIAVTAANSYTFATGSFAPSANATVQLGLTGARWSNIWGLASSAQYADLAEYYVSDADYEPGTVVDFGGVNEVTICGTVMSTRIAGVVSTEPGFVMNDGQAGEFTLPIALQGRVPTKVVGKVNKGDMMVSAGNGYAHSCSAPVIGSVIGKALADFDGTEGVIEVVVGRV